MLAVAIVVVQPAIAAPARERVRRPGDGGPVVSGPLFPFLFVTIACGALSGFHALISSGTTPKLIEKERQTRLIGYGGMLMESFVAIMALVAALSIDRGIYFAMNASAAATGGTVETAAAFVNGLGLAGVNITPDVLGADRPRRRRGVDRLPHRWRTDAGRRARAHHAAAHRRLRADGVLVPLRDHVRGAVHPDRRRRRHPGGPLHAAGLRRQLRPAVPRHLVAARRVGLHRGHGGRLGRDPDHGRHRPARRHQHPLPAVRHRQPAARGDRAGGVPGDRRRPRPGRSALDTEPCRWPSPRS